MASDDINLSLDDIIKKNKSLRNVDSRRKPSSRQSNNRRRSNSVNSKSSVRSNNMAGSENKRRSRSSVRYSSHKRAHGYDRRYDAYIDPRRIDARRPVDYNAGETKLVISNLDFGVTQNDLEELFEDIDPLVHCRLHYNRGNPIGSASVVFKKRAGALLAINIYNDAPLDGRPMRMEIAASGPTHVTGNKPLGVRNRINHSSGNSPKSGSKRFSGGNRSRSRVARRNRNSHSTSLSTEQLDKELDDYRNRRL